MCVVKVENQTTMIDPVKISIETAEKIFRLVEGERTRTLVKSELVELLEMQFRIAFAGLLVRPTNPVPKNLGELERDVEYEFATAYREIKLGRPNATARSLSRLEKKFRELGLRLERDPSPSSEVDTGFSPKVTPEVTPDEAYTFETRKTGPKGRKLAERT